MDSRGLEKASVALLKRYLGTQDISTAGCNGKTDIIRQVRRLLPLLLHPISHRNRGPKLLEPRPPKTCGLLTDICAIARCLFVSAASLRRGDSATSPHRALQPEPGRVQRRSAHRSLCVLASRMHRTTNFTNFNCACLVQTWAQISNARWMVVVRMCSRTHTRAHMRVDRLHFFLQPQAEGTCTHAIWNIRPHANHCLTPCLPQRNASGSHQLQQLQPGTHRWIRCHVGSTIMARCTLWTRSLRRENAAGNFSRGH